MPDERVTVRVGPWRPPPQYNQPQLEPDGDIRTVEHEVLGDATIIQNLGNNAERFTLRGDCFDEDVSELRALRGVEVGLRHSIFSGDVLVERVSASSTSSYEKEDGDVKWVYEYTIEMIRVD